MRVLREAYFLLLKELTTEWRERHSIGGVVLYVVSTVFVVYLAIIKVDPRVWNALLWIVILFASVNAANRSFVKERDRRALTYFQLAQPSSVLLSKMLYNSLLLTILALLAFGGFQLISEITIRRPAVFCMTLVLGASSFAVVLTFISGLASRARNAPTLMAILSFPILVPILMTVLKLSAYGIGMITDTAWKTDILVLLAIDGILISVGYLLFPYIWRE